MKWIYNRLLPTLLALAALAGLWLLGQQTESRAYDLFMQLSAQPAKGSKVVLVLIDDASIEKLKPRFGAVPWPRQRHVDVFRQINTHAPALMVLDSHFVNINEPNDADVFSQMKSFRNLITGLVMQEMPGPESNELNTDIPQYYRLNLGVVSNRLEPDGSIRSLKPVYQVRANAGQVGIFPALSLAAAYEYLTMTHSGVWVMDVERKAKPDPLLKLYPEKNPEDGIRLPMSQGDAFFLRFYSLLPGSRADYQRSHPSLPLWKLFDDAYQAEVDQALKGKIVLIGSSSTFYRDYSPTPVSLRHLGPDIHATAIDNILNGTAIRKLPVSINFLILWLLFLGVFLLRFRVSNLGQTVLYTLGTMIIYCALTYWLFAQQSVWLDVITPELFILMAFLAGSTFRIIFKERQLVMMQSNMKQLVDPDVYREIEKMSELLRPGGDKLEITSMFVDIRNFTTLSETLPASEVFDMLNEFYGEIVRVVFAHHGTVDKFMADGVLLIFGAPLPSEQHRLMGLNAAKDILQMSSDVAKRLKETRNFELEVGISLNSGTAVVGWLGPKSNMQYTAVGDTVNTCVRLQDQAKLLHTRLILSESTASAIAGEPDLVELGEVHVRGRESGIRIYTLTSAFTHPV